MNNEENLKNEENETASDINVETADEEVVIKKEKKRIKHLEKEIHKIEDEKAELVKEKEKLEEENLSLKDQILRKQADFENYRKRMIEEKQKDRKYCLQDFLEEAIEMLDIFDLQVSKETDDEKLNKYLNGFRMINTKLKNILENNGVVVIDCLNKPFDPSHSSALETIEVEGVEPNIVVEVVMRGYMYKDKVLRPAMVKVSK